MQPEYDNQTLIIFYDPKIGSEPLLQAVQQYGARVVYRYQNFNGISIAIPSDKKILAAQKHFESVCGVLSVQRNGVYHLD